MSRRDRGLTFRAFALVVLLPCAALAGDVAADLLQLVPRDAGITLTVAELRDHLAAISNSTLAKSFETLPSVKAWFASPAGARYAYAKREIEKAFGASLATIRDDVLGDAVVFALHLAPESSPEAARGLVLAKARDRALLARLIDRFNNLETANGSLAEVANAGTGDRAYLIRRSKPGGKETEYYRLFDDGTFAWSNSEALLKGVLDRKAGAGDGLGSDPAYQAVRRGLPPHALVTVHINPRFADRVLAATPLAGKPDDDRAAEILTRYLRTVEGIGLAFEWRDGFLLHSHEVLKPKGIDARLLRWARSRATPDTLSRRIPHTAIAAAAAPIDFEAAYDALVELVPGGDRPRLDTMLVALQGIMLGKAVRQEILPRLGPALIAYIEAPSADSERFPMVGVLELRDDHGEHGIAAALDNALRTVLSLYALDPGRQALQLRVESRQAGPLRVTTLGGKSSPFSYAVGPDCLVVGTSADAVARFGGSKPDTRLSPFKADYFPNARAYAAIDLARLADVARSHREALARRFAASRGGSPESVSRDLDQAVALLDLFGGAFFAVAVDPELTSVHQTIGLIAR